MDKRIFFLKKQMLSNLRHSPTMEEMARLVNLSESHLQQLFKHTVGMSPIQYLQDLRLEKARELLEDSFLQIREIGFQVGMSDQSHFIYTS
jgi:AraC family transcriptional regulator